MTVDDLAAPLGQGPKGHQRSIKIAAARFIAGALALFLAVFAVWTVVSDDPLGGEPRAVVPANIQIAAKAPAALPQTAEVTGSIQNGQPAPATPPAQPAAPANTMTVTIIDGKTGAKQEVTVPLRGVAAAAAEPGLYQKLLETSPYGPIPKIAADGTRPADAFAQPVHPIAGKPDAPRIAVIVGGLGLNRGTTTDAIGKLPAAVTLGFMPNGNDVASIAAKARGGGHELLLQVPMEASDNGDHDSGSQTLLTSLTPEQNIDRFYRLMSRLQGYVGIINAMGARFTASEQSLAPVLNETAKRGLDFVDDGSNPASVAGRIAAADKLPFARAEVTIDSSPAPDDIDRALGRLEAAARQHGIAVGFASRPASIDRIAQWAKTAADRGLLLVPISAAVTVKPGNPADGLRMTQDK
jgi:uncharacterized protein